MRNLLLCIPLLFLFSCNNGQPKVNSQKFLRAWVDSINATPLYRENRSEYKVNLLTVSPQKSSITSRGHINRSNVSLYIKENSTSISTEVYKTNSYEPLGIQIAHIVQQQKSKSRYDTYHNKRWRLYIDTKSSMATVKNILQTLHANGVQEVCFMAASSDTVPAVSIPDETLHKELAEVHKNSNEANRASKIATLLRPVVHSNPKFQNVFDQTASAIYTYRDSTYLEELIKACVGTDTEQVKKMLTLAHYFMCYERELMDSRLVTIKEGGHTFDENALWGEAGKTFFSGSASSVWF